MPKRYRSPSNPLNGRGENSQLAYNQLQELTPPTPPRSLRGGTNPRTRQETGLLFPLHQTRGVQELYQVRHSLKAGNVLMTSCLYNLGPDIQLFDIKLPT